MLVLESLRGSQPRCGSCSVFLLPYTVPPQNSCVARLSITFCAATERRSDGRIAARGLVPGSSSVFRSLSTFKQGVRRLRDHYRRCRAAVRVRADGNATKAPREKRFLEAVGAGNFTFEGCFSSGALAVGLRGAHFASQGVWKFARNGAGSQGGRSSPFRGSLRRTVAISSRAESPVRVSDHAKPPPPSHAAAHLPPRPQF